MNDQPGRSLETPEQARVKRLDEVAKLLATATTLTAALLTAFGVSSARIPHLLDNQESRIWLIGAGLGAALALGLALWGLASGSARAEALILFVGAVALVGGLGASVMAAAEGFSGNGRPTITAVSIAPSTQGAFTIKFTVKANGVNSDERLVVLAGTQAQPSSGTASVATPPASYYTTLRPDDQGVISQTVSFGLKPATGTNELAIRVYRFKDAPDSATGVTDSASTSPPDCESTNESRAPACVNVALPMATQP